MGNHLTPEWGMFWIAFATFLFTGLGAFAGVVWSISKHEEKWRKEFTDILELYKTEIDKKIDRQYQRFDEFKKGLEGTHVRKDSCDLIHAGSTKELAAMNKKLESLETKFDELKDYLMKNGINK